MKNYIILLCIKLFILSLPLIANGNDGIDKRIVFDIGSGSTQGTLYLIDKYNNSIVYKSQYNVSAPYQECLNNSTSNIIDTQCLKVGIDAISKIKKSLNIDCIHDQCIGLATAWARKTANIEDIIKEIAKTGVNVQVLSQYDEGKLAFLSARDSEYYANILKNHNLRDKQIMTIDIGGGSFQITKFQNDQYMIYNGPHGVISIYDFLCKTLNSNFQYDISANISKIIDEEIFKNNIIQIQNMNTENNIIVIGIGKLLELGLSKQLNLGKVIHIEDIDNLMKNFLDSSVDDISQRYNKIPVAFLKYMTPGLILTSSIMHKLNIDKIYIVPNLNLGDDFAINYDKWNRKIT